MKIAVIGTGYVGLVTGVVLADLGNEVICVDNDKAKVDRLKSGKSTIFEPGVEEILQRCLADGRFIVTDSIAKATKESEIVFIAVGTPPGEDGSPDVTAVKAVAKEIGKNIDKYTIVVNKSTVPIGAGDMVEEIIRGEGVNDSLFDVVSNPEFLREGTAVYDTMNPDRIIIGAKRRDAASKLVELYSAFEKEMYITDVKSAELIKYASNSFLAMKISFINAISRICEQTGANVASVAKGIGSDHRIGPQFLQAGLGWGGSCLPKDVQGLISTADRYGYDFKLLKEVVDINTSQTEHFIDRIAKRLGGLEDKKIGLLGLAFKPNTDDIRDAKSLIIIDEILKRKGRVMAHDPVAAPAVQCIHPTIGYTEDPYSVAENSDAIILVTEWPQYKNLDLARLANSMKSKVLFDGRRFFAKNVAERAGFEYYTIGS